MSSITESSGDRSTHRSQILWRPGSQFASSSEGEASCGHSASRLGIPCTVNVLEKACTTCGATDTPMWRNGACGPKTLCNACGVKYQRHVHKEKIAAEAQRNLDLAIVGSPDDSGLRDRHGGRSQRSRTSGSRGASLGRQAGQHGDNTSEDTDTGSATLPLLKSKRRGRSKAAVARSQRQTSFSCLAEAHASPTISGRPSSKSGSRKMRSASHVGPRATHTAAVAAGCSTVGGHSAPAAPLPVRRLDGLHMQRQYNGVVLALSNVTVLLQPVTQAQRLWGAAPDAGPAVAICAYDSSGSFLAAAPRTAGGSDLGSWAFPNSTSAAWISGHDWMLFFTERQEYDDFNKLLTEWKAAADSLAAAPSGSDPSSETSSIGCGNCNNYTNVHGSQGQSGSRHGTVRQQRQPSAGVHKKSRKRTVNCISAVDADGLGAFGPSCVAPGDIHNGISISEAPTDGDHTAVHTQQNCVSSGKGATTLHQSYHAICASNASAGVFEGLPMVPEVASLEGPDLAGKGRHPSGNCFTGLSLPTGSSANGLQPDELFFGGPSAHHGPLTSLSFDGTDVSRGYGMSQAFGEHERSDACAIQNLESSCALVHADGSLGSASDISAATGFHHLNNRFHSLNFASSGNLAALGCGHSGASGSQGPTAEASHASASRCPSSQYGARDGSYGCTVSMSLPVSQPTNHGYSQSSFREALMTPSLAPQLHDQHEFDSEAIEVLLPDFKTEDIGREFSSLHPNPYSKIVLPDAFPPSADPEARVRDGQLFNGTSFASMPLVAQPVDSVPSTMAAPSDADFMLLDDSPGLKNILEEFDFDIDPLDPQFLDQVSDPAETAVRGGDAARQVLHGFVQLPELPEVKQPTKERLTGELPQATAELEYNSNGELGSLKASDACFSSGFLLDAGVHYGRPVDSSSCSHHEGGVPLSPLDTIDGSDLLLPPSDIDWLEVALCGTENPQSTSSVDLFLDESDPPALDARKPCHGNEQGQKNAVIALELHACPSVAVGPSQHGQPTSQVSPQGSPWDLSVQQAASSMEECYLPWSANSRIKHLAPWPLSIAAGGLQLSCLHHVGTADSIRDRTG